MIGEVDKILRLLQSVEERFVALPGIGLSELLLLFLLLLVVPFLVFVFLLLLVFLLVLLAVSPWATFSMIFKNV